MSKRTQIEQKRGKKEIRQHQRLYKDFMSPYVGEVTSVPKGKFKYYEVLYEDWDVEELNARELKKYVSYYNKSQQQQHQFKKRKISKNASQPYAIGTKMMKDFPRSFEAEVTKIPCSKRTGSKYRIRFMVDKVEEDITADELEPLVKAYNDLMQRGHFTPNKSEGKAGNETDMKFNAAEKTASDPERWSWGPNEVMA